MNDLPQTFIVWLQIVLHPLSSVQRTPGLKKKALFLTSAFNNWISRQCHQCKFLEDSAIAFVFLPCFLRRRAKKEKQRIWLISKASLLAHGSSAYGEPSSAQLKHTVGGRTVSVSDPLWKGGGGVFPSRTTHYRGVPVMSPLESLMDFPWSQLLPDSEHQHWKWTSSWAAAQSLTSHKYYKHLKHFCGCYLWLN